MTIHVQERDHFDAVCPHCNKELHAVVAVKLSASILSKRLMFCCPHCGKVLGVMHRKGLLAS